MNNNYYMGDNKPMAPTDSFETLTELMNKNHCLISELEKIIDELGYEMFGMGPINNVEGSPDNVVKVESFKRDIERLNKAFDKLIDFRHRLLG